MLGSVNVQPALTVAVRRWRGTWRSCEASVIAPDRLQAHARRLAWIDGEPLDATLASRAAGTRHRACFTASRASAVGAGRQVRTKRKKASTLRAITDRDNTLKSG
jgi:hypothetical protein